MKTFSEIKKEVDDYLKQDSDGTFTEKEISKFIDMAVIDMFLARFTKRFKKHFKKNKLQTISEEK